MVIDNLLIANGFG